MKEVFLIRHGETEYNSKGVVQGSGVDSSLNELGWEQAMAFYNYYGDHGFQVLFHSNLKRSKQTLEPFIQNGIPAVEVPELREISWGVYEGRSYSSEMKQSYHELIGEWGSGNLHAKFEKGESAFQLFQRCHAAWDIIRSYPASKILVCSHGRTIRALMCVLEQKDASEMESVQHSNTGLFRIVFDSDLPFVLTRNDISHLASMSI